MIVNTQKDSQSQSSTLGDIFSGYVSSSYHAFLLGADEFAPQKKEFDIQFGILKLNKDEYQFFIFSQTHTCIRTSHTYSYNMQINAHSHSHSNAHA